MSVTFYDDRASWLAGRKSVPCSLGGSDIAAVLGRSSYRGPWDLWAEVHNPEALPTRDEPDHFDVRSRGHIVEPALIRWWRDAARKKVNDSLAIARHAEHPWAAYSPDGMVEGGGLIEAKTFGSPDRDKWAKPLPEGAPRPLPEAPWVDHVVTGAGLRDAVLDGLLPDGYAYQIVHGMWVCGAPWVDVVAVECGLSVVPISISAGGRITHDAWTVNQWPPVCIRVERDERLVSWLANTVTAWRQRHLVEGVEPDPDSSRACRRALVYRNRPGTREAASDDLDLVAAYQEAHAMEKAGKSDKALLGNRLLAAMGDAHTITDSEGKTLARVQTDKRGRRSLKVTTSKTTKTETNA